MRLFVFPSTNQVMNGVGKIKAINTCLSYLHTYTYLGALKAPRAEVVLVLSRSRSVTPHDPSSEDQRPCISTMYSLLQKYRT